MVLFVLQQVHSGLQTGNHTWFSWKVVLMVFLVFTVYNSWGQIRLQHCINEIRPQTTGYLEILELLLLIQSVFISGICFKNRLLSCHVRFHQTFGLWWLIELLSRVSLLTWNCLLELYKQDWSRVTDLGYCSLKEIMACVCAFANKLEQNTRGSFHRITLGNRD